MKTPCPPEKFRKWWNVSLPEQAILAVNGGPLEKELVGEVFSLWSWQGPGGPAPVRIIADLRPYAVRPEAITMIQVNGQSRILFGEDRFRAVGYGTRNAIHWPISILGDPSSL